MNSHVKSLASWCSTASRYVLAAKTASDLGPVHTYFWNRTQILCRGASQARLVCAPRLLVCLQTCLVFSGLCCPGCLQYSPCSFFRSHLRSLFLQEAFFEPPPLVLCSPSVLSYYPCSPIKDLTTLSFDCLLTCLPNEPVFYRAKAHGWILLPTILSVDKIKSVCRGGSHMRVLLGERVVQVWGIQRRESCWFTQTGAGKLKQILRAK